MARRILSVSYDEFLLYTRSALLREQGYEVVSATGFVESLEKCRTGGFDLFILGHSIPHKDKQELVEAFRRNCPAPVMSLLRRGEQRGVDADFYAQPDDPRELLQAVAKALGTERGHGA